MPGWIRERGTASAANTPEPSSSGNAKSKVVAKAGSRSEPRPKSRQPMVQSSLKNHFAPDRSGRSAASSATTALGEPSTTNDSMRRVASRWEDTPSTRNSTEPKKRKLLDVSKDTDNPSPSKKIRKRKEDNEGSYSEGEEVVSARPLNLFDPMSLFGPPPQSSLTPRPRPAQQKKKIRINSKVGRMSPPKLPAPAISPKRKKSLIVDSAWECAMQQHRNWERSSSPLQEISNRIFVPYKSPKKVMENELQSSESKRTPSKLRHGYSMLAFDENAYRAIQSSDRDNDGQEDFDDRLDEDCPSPSAERQERATLNVGLTYTRSPRSNKKIYAQETQQPNSSPLLCHKGLGIRRTSHVDGVPVPLPEANAIRKDMISPLDDSEPLSSPPASPLLEAFSKEMPSSSQTAPGGSFSMRSHAKKVDDVGSEQVKAWAETYMSEDDEDIEELCGLGDETYKLPSSEIIIGTPIKECQTKQKLRSASKAQDRGEEYDHDVCVEEDNETQLLPWSPCSEKRRERPDNTASTKAKRMRVSESWADVNRVWSQVEMSQEQIVTDPTEKLQCSLLRFGFQSKPGEVDKMKRKKSLEGISLTNDVIFGSDEEVESDFEQEEDEEVDLGEKTQVLQWEEEDSERGRERRRSSSMEEEGEQEDEWSASMFLPSQGDMDTQIRHFLED